MKVIKKMKRIKDKQQKLLKKYKQSDMTRQQEILYLQKAKVWKVKNNLLDDIGDSYQIKFQGEDSNET